MNVPKLTSNTSNDTHYVCYLSASSHINLRTFRELLAAKNIRSVVASELPSTTTTVLGEIVKAITNADIFIAVLDSEWGNTQVYFELGIAVAIGVRILLLLSPGVNLPLDTTELLSIRANIENDEAINFALDQILAVSPSTKYKSREPIPVDQRSKPIGDYADKLLERIEALGDQIKEIDIIDVVVLALREGAIPIIVREPGVQDTVANVLKRSRVDIALWSDELDPWIGNPLLIEVKKSLKDQRQYADATNQALEYIQQFNTRSALIICLERYPTLLDLSSTISPNIFFLEIRELLIRLRTNSFAEVIQDLRNRRIHGVGA